MKRASDIYPTPVWSKSDALCGGALAVRLQGPPEGSTANLAEPDTHQNPSANLASSDIISGLQGGSKTILGWTAVTPGRSPTNSFICSETWGPIGQAGVVRVKVT